jgi:hypothetical protein
MKFKSLALAAALAVAALPSFAAQSTFSGSLNGTDQTVSTFAASGSFTSVINFVNSTGFSAWLTNGSSTFNYVPSSHMSLGGGLYVIDSYSLGGSLANSNWSVHVRGTGGTFDGSSTYGVGSLPSAPVPEPESYAMLLAGLGALGFMGRRRQTKKA